MREGGLDPAKHEARDVTYRFIWLGASLVAGAVVMLALSILLLFPDSRQDQNLRLPLPDYPQPRLQQDPAADLRSFEQERQDLLERPKASKQNPGIPIEEAMRQVAEEKIAGWPSRKAEAEMPNARPPEGEHAASNHTSTPAPPTAALDRRGARPSVGGRSKSDRVPPKIRRPLTPRRGAR